MDSKYLVVNGGSSSLKFSLFDKDENEMVNGYVEKIGKEDSSYTLKFDGQKIEKKVLIPNHTKAVEVMINELLENKFVNNISEIKGVGHRVLHGGEIYSSSVIIDEGVLNDIKALTKLGPLHHPGQVAIIESLEGLLPDVPQVAVFDTAFHHTMPMENYLYPVPMAWYKENDVRKYGFHGTSYRYINEYMKKYLDKDDPNLIVCHIGSGASIACIKGGKCYDTSMGLTPLDGLIMGTRSGSIDPSIINYICKERNLSVEEVNQILNKESGLIAIGGKNDFRDLTALSNAGDKNATLAIEMLKNSVVKYIAQYYFELEGNVDSIVFTAGMGENGILMREKVVNAISGAMGVKLNKEANDNISRFKANQEGIISTPDSNVLVMVVPTNEELMILRDTHRLVNEKNKIYKKV